MTVPAAVASGRVLRGGRLLASCAIGTSVVADVLFHDQRFGANLAAFGAGLLALVLLVRHRHRRLVSRERRLVYTMIGLIAISLVEPGIIVTALFVLALWTVAVGAIGRWPDRVVDWLAAIARLPQELAARVFIDDHLRRRWNTRHGGRGRRNAIILRWSVPVAMAVVFVALFGLRTRSLRNGSRRRTKRAAAPCAICLETPRSRGSVCGLWRCASVTPSCGAAGVLFTQATRRAF